MVLLLFFFYSFEMRQHWKCKIMCIVLSECWVTSLNAVHCLLVQLLKICWEWKMCVFKVMFVHLMWSFIMCVSCMNYIHTILLWETCFLNLWKWEVILNGPELDWKSQLCNVMGLSSLSIHSSVCSEKYSCLAINPPIPSRSFLNCIPTTVKTLDLSCNGNYKR